MVIEGETGINCIHHWMIVPPDGRTWLEGTCKKCGEEKQFRATPPPNKYFVQKFIIVDEEKSTEDIAEEEAKDTDEW